MIPVDFVLRTNTAAFTRGVASAENSLRGLQRGLRSFGGGNLAGAIGIAGMMRGFTAVLNSAQDARAELEKAGKPVDRLTEGAAALGDTLDAAGTRVKKIAIGAIGALTEVGGYARRTLQGITRAEEDAAIALAKSTGKVADQMEKDQAERERKHAADREPARLAEAEQKLADQRRQNAMDNSDAAGKLVLLLMEQKRIETELQSLEVGTISRREKELELLKLQNDVAKQRKDAAAEEARYAEEKRRNDEAIIELERDAFVIARDRDRLVKAEQTARADRILPSIEQLAAKATENEQARANYGIGATGSLVEALDPNSAEVRAKRALDLEQMARDAALSSDPVQRLQMAGQFQSEAEQIRAGLAGVVQSRDTDLSADFKEALSGTEDRLEEVIKTLEGKFKAQ